MTDETPQPTRGLARRTLLRNGLLTGVGAAVAAVALPGLTGVAQAATVQVLAMDPFGEVDQWSAQTQWWWCNACRGLFWSNSGAPAGLCPASPSFPHDNSASGMYELPFLTYADAGVQDAQAGWRWCNQCQGLFWGSGLANSHCPGNVITPYVSSGPHAFGSSTSYIVLMESEEGAFSEGTPPLQTGWHWCNVCQGLFYPPGGAAKNGGVCPVNFSSPHTAGGTVYQLFTS
jgi:hypothetical protein